MMTLDRAQFVLQQFVAKDNAREWMKTPCRIDQWVVATNGRILVALPWHDGLTGIADIPWPEAHRIVSVREMIGRAVDDLAQHTPQDLPAMRPARRCGECGGSGKVRLEVCPDCLGDGFFSHGNHDYDCKNCDGKGNLVSDTAPEETCSHCGGDGCDPNDHLDIGAARFALRYLNVLQSIGARIVPGGGDGRGLFLTDDGALGVIMGMRKD